MTTLSQTAHEIHLPGEDDSLVNNGGGRNVKHRTRACIPCSKIKKRCIPSEREEPEGGKGTTGKKAKKNPDNRPCENCETNALTCSFPGEDGRSKPDRSSIRQLRASNELLHQHLQVEKDKVQDLQRRLRPPERAVTMDKLSEELRHKLVLDISGGHPESFGAPCPYNFPGTDSPRPLSPQPRSRLDGTTFLVHNDGLQWNSHLPASNDFPLSRQEHDQLIDLFFECFAFWGLRGHRNSFEGAMREALSHSPPSSSRASAHYSPVQHNAMLAIAMGLSLDPRLNDLDARLMFIRKAKEYTLEEMEAPTYAGILGFSYLVSFFSGVGMRSAASIYFGACAGMAQVLGLGLDMANLIIPGMSEQEKHEREWLFWVIFCQDKCLALHLGREMRIGRPKYPQPPSLPHETDEGKAALFLCQRALCLVGTNVLEKIYYGRRLTRDGMTQLLNEVHLWIEQVPAQLRVSDNPIQDKIRYGRYQLLLFLTYARIKLCVHHLFYRETTSSSRCMAWTSIARQESDLAAARILDIFQVYATLYELHRIPLCAVPIAFLAGVVFVYQLERTREPREEQVISGRLDQIMGILSTMEKTWQCAGEQRRILRGYNHRVNPGQTAMYAFTIFASNFITLNSTLDYSPSVHSASPARRETTTIGSTPVHSTVTTMSYALLPAHESVPSPTTNSGGGSSRANLAHSDSIMDMDALTFEYPLDLRPEMESLHPASRAYIQPTSPLGYGVFGVNQDAQLARFADNHVHCGPSTILQPQPDLPMHIHDSPMASGYLPYGFASEEMSLSGMTRAFASTSGSAGAGRVSPQSRPHLPCGDRRSPSHGLMLERPSSSGSGRGHAGPSHSQGRYNPNFYPGW